MGRIGLRFVLDLACAEIGHAMDTSADAARRCVVPDWIETDRAKRELARMRFAERAAAPAPIPPEAVADAVVELIRDDALAGRVAVHWPGEERRLLDLSSPARAPTPR